MKRFICSTAVASALLAATAISLGGYHRSCWYVFVSVNEATTGDSSVYAAHNRICYSFRCRVPHRSVTVTGYPLVSVSTTAFNSAVLLV